MLIRDGHRTTGADPIPTAFQKPSPSHCPHYLPYLRLLKSMMPPRRSSLTTKLSCPARLGKL